MRQLYAPGHEHVFNKFYLSNIIPSSTCPPWSWQLIGSLKENLWVASVCITFCLWSGSMRTWPWCPHPLAPVIVLTSEDTAFFLSHLKNREQRSTLVYKTDRSKLTTLDFALTYYIITLPFGHLLGYRPHYILSWSSNKTQDSHLNVPHFHWFILIQ